MLTDAQIAALVGRTVLARGEDVRANGRVVSVARNGSTVVGHVTGSNDEQYVAVVNFAGTGDAARPRHGTCSCPVRLNCKHVAATLLTLMARERSLDALPDTRATGSNAATGREGERTARDYASKPEWQRTFEGLLDDAPSPPRAAPPALTPWGTRVTTEVALMVEATPVTRSSRVAGVGGVNVTVRPLAKGRTGTWVRQGVSWQDFRYPDASISLPPEQFTALRALAALGDVDYLNSSVLGIHIERLPGPALWAALTEAHRTGVPFLHPDRSELVFEPRPVPVVLKISHSRRKEGGLRVSAGFDLPRTWRETPNIVRLGDPAAGILGWGGTPEPGRSTALRLAATRPLDPSVVSLRDRPSPLLVPEDDVERFFAQVLPRLRGLVDQVVVADGVAMPAAPAPTLWLDVDRSPSHDTRLRWEWRYAPTGADDAAPQTLGPALLTADLGTPALGAMRDEAAENAILDRVLDVVPRLLQHVERGFEQGVGTEELSGLDTVTFFAEELPELHAAAASIPGFEIDVHGEGVDYRLVEHVDVTVDTTERENDRDWFDLQVRVSVGDQEVPYEVLFRAIAAGSSHLLLADGSYFALDDPRFERLRDIIAEARAMQEGTGGPLRVSRFQATLFEELEAIGVVGDQAAQWRDALGALAQGGAPTRIDVPATMHAELRPYQRDGLDWLAFLAEHHLGGVLADDMGLGKTIQTLAFVAHLLGQDLPDGAAPGTRRPPVLVVAPTSVVGNWVGEARRFVPALTTVSVSTTAAKRRGRTLADEIGDADIVVTSYALFRLDFESYDSLDWSTLVLDEAQFVKNHQSVGYQCARKLRTPTKIALTGTPLENNLMELWSIMSIVCPGLFPSPTRFAEHFARPIERKGDNVRLAQLRRRVAPFMVRRTKEAVAADLPPKIEAITEVDLNPRHRKVYDRLLARERARVLGLVDDLDGHRFEVLRSLTILRQAALDVSLVADADPHIAPAEPGDDAAVGPAVDGPAVHGPGSGAGPHHAPSSKLEVLFEMLDDILAEEHSVLIFSQFTQFLGKVRDGLVARGVEHSYLDGRTRNRQETIERFTSGGTKVFLISLKAGGFGLNLTAADYCILLDPWWNPAAEAQAVDRAHRIGQTKQVMVYRLVAQDTIEEKVMALKAGKSALFTSVLDGGAAGGAGLSAQDVRELLS